MEKFVNNIILEKVDSIIEDISTSKVYNDYQFLSDKLSKNKNIMDIIERVKSLQKQIVKKELLKESTTELENEISLLLGELNKIPLYFEFIDKQKELDSIYQSIKERLDEYFYDILN